MKIVIADYGVGNTYSVTNAIKGLGYNLTISDKEEDIKKADCIILPGVGAFDEAMRNLRSRSLDKILEVEVIENKKPLLGICVGMQMFSDFSEENGYHEGLGWIPGKVVRLAPSESLVVPHVGWNNIELKSNEGLFKRMNNDSNFYFDHSYHFQCADEFKVATCEYGQQVTAAVAKENVFGVQFHPEKSQVNGLKLFRNFFNSIMRNA